MRSKDAQKQLVRTSLSPQMLVLSHKSNKVLYVCSSLSSCAILLIKLVTSKVAMSGCPSPYTTSAKYLARYISFNATDARPAL